MKKQKAFTLVELMVAMALALILASWAVPNVRSLLLNNKITTKTNGFIAAINYARNEAITHSNNIIVIEPGIVQSGKLTFYNGTTPPDLPGIMNLGKVGEYGLTLITIKQQMITTLSKFLILKMTKLYLMPIKQP
ncbi:secreted protein [Beggiatoa sp. PS]|nr:secreted protein [Beggiatoa sp. PS]